MQGARQHLAVEPVLAAEVVVHIRLGQARGFGDGGRGGTAEAGASEHTLGGEQDRLARRVATRLARAAGGQLRGRQHRVHFFVAASHTTWVQAAAPGSFLMTGALPAVISTFTVRSNAAGSR